MPFTIPDKMWEASVSFAVLFFVGAVIWRCLPWVRGYLQDVRNCNNTNTKVNRHLAVTNRMLTKNVSVVTKMVNHKGNALMHLCEAAKEAAAIEGPCQNAMQKALPHINMAIEELKQLPGR